MDPQPAGFLGGGTVRVWSQTLLTDALNAACGVFTGVLVARLLLPEGRGALAVVLYWPQLLGGLGLLSIPTAVVYHRAKIKEERAASFAASAFWMALGLAIVLALVGFPILPRLVDEKSLAELSQLYLLLWLPFHFVSLTLLAVDHGQQAFNRYNALRLVPQWAYLCLLLVLWATQWATVPTVVFASWVGVLVTAVLRVGIGRQDLRARPRLRHLRPLLGSALGFHGASLLGLLAVQLDRIIVVSTFDHALIGHYMVAVSFATVGLNLVQGAFSTLLFPKMAAASSDVRHRELLARTLRYTSFLLLSGGLPLVLAAPWIVPLLFGSAFEAAVPLAQILVAACLFQALREVIVVACRGMHLFIPPMIAEGTAVAGTVLAVVPFVGAFGGIGVPVALTVGNLLAFGYLLLVIRLRLRIRLSDWWGLTFTTGLMLFREARAVLTDARTP